MESPSKNGVKDKLSYAKYLLFVQLDPHGNAWQVKSSIRLSRQMGSMLLRTSSYDILRAGNKQSYPILRARNDQSYGILRAGNDQSHGILRAGNDQSYGILRAGNDQSYGILRAGNDQSYGILRAGNDQSYGREWSTAEINIKKIELKTHFKIPLLYWCVLGFWFIVFSAKMALTVRLSDSDNGKLTSVVDLPGDVLIIPQATLGGTVKGKVMQYHKNIAKDEGLRLYSEFVSIFKKTYERNEKCLSAGTIVRHGTYGNRQVFSCQTNGPYTHLIEIWCICWFTFDNIWPALKRCHVAIICLSEKSYPWIFLKYHQKKWLMSHGDIFWEPWLPLKSSDATVM